MAQVWVLLERQNFPDGFFGQIATSFPSGDWSSALIS
jgi:hypothetical protein